MVIGNARVFVEGRLQEGSVTVEQGRIAAVGGGGGPCDVDAGGCYLTPGFVDLHTHGAMNQDFSDGSPAGLPILSRYYAAHGVTSFLATTMTLPEEVLTTAMHAIRDFVRPVDGARCAGVHLEGPFLSYAKRGAQAAEHLRRPDVNLFRRLNRASGNRVRMVTVAPEIEGAIPFIQAVSPICAVSVGHTDADYETALAAYAAGASHTTHLFNGMKPFHHRAPGVIGAAFDSGATVELICDGLHIHPAAIRGAYRLFGEKLVIISDSLRCAGMPDGPYELGGQPIQMQNGKATLQNTDTLAGSSTNLLAELRNVVSFGLSLEAALTALTIAPARAARLDSEIGSIAVGKRADLLLLNSDLTLKAVYIGGVSIL